MTLVMQLSDNDVHLYLAPLTATASQEQVLLDTLSDDERKRAARFINPLHQQRFVIAHGQLRMLLGDYLTCAPSLISFSTRSHQKPCLADQHDDPLQFNLSHSEDHAAFAFTRIGDIGIDIESIQADPKLDVANRFFSEEERVSLSALPSAEQATAFYQLWSRKEAIIKANGKGLSQPLNSFSVALTNEAETVHLNDEQWSLYPLSLHPSFASALAVQQPIQRLFIWDIIEQEPVFRCAINPTITL